MHLTQRHQLPDLTRAIRDADLVAIDTEFHAERRYLPQLFLVQLNLPGGGVHLLDPMDPQILPPLAEALLSRPWVVHAGRQDLRILYPLLGGLPDEVWDTQLAAGLVGAPYPARYADLVQMHLGEDLAKGATMSDWSRRPLSDRQLRYAADDVRLLPDLWRALHQALVDRDRLELARDACAEARLEAITPPELDEIWRTLPASRALDGVALAVLQDLCAWREERALLANQPARSVLGDGLLVDLARRRPTSIGQMMANRRFPKRVAQKLGDDLLALIARSSQRPPESWPRGVGNHTDEARRMALVELALDVVGSTEGWSRAMVVPDPLLARVILSESPTTAARELLVPWRDALAGDALQAVLESRVALRLGNDGRPVLSETESRS